MSASRYVMGFLVCIFVFDMATPLLPGAFRFNPDESIDVLCPHSGRAVAFAADFLPDRRQFDRLIVPQSPEKGPWRGPLPKPRREELLPRRTSSPSCDRSSTSPEDH